MVFIDDTYLSYEVHPYKQPCLRQDTTSLLKWCVDCFVD
jgi:hypothetical protein